MVIELVSMGFVEALMVLGLVSVAIWAALMVLEHV